MHCICGKNKSSQINKEINNPGAYLCIHVDALNLRIESRTDALRRLSVALSAEDLCSGAR